MVLSQMEKLFKAKQHVNTIDRIEDEGMVQKEDTSACKKLRSTHVAE